MSADELNELDIFYQTFGNPIFQTPFGKKYLINADTTASGQPHRQIEKYINKKILPFYNNTHSNAFSGKLMTSYIRHAKHELIEQLNIDTQNTSIVFSGSGCTGAIRHLIHALDFDNFEIAPMILISVMEHHSNLLPWLELRRKHKIKLKIISINVNGQISLSRLKKYLQRAFDEHREIFCSFTACSNVTGIKSSIDKITKLVHTYNGKILFDFACSAPYVDMNMNNNFDEGYYIDALYFSPHKFFGGIETPGVLVARNELFRNEIPFYPGGGTVRFACTDYCKYSDKIETRESGGTPNIIGCIKVGLVLLLKKTYKTIIEKRENEIVKFANEYLRSISSLTLINANNTHALPIFSFRVENYHYNLIVVLLNDLFGIQTRGGISCCSLYAQEILTMSKKEKKQVYYSIVNGTGVPNKYGWTRVTFHYSMPWYIVNYILRAIKFVAINIEKLSKLYVYDKDSNNFTYRDFDVEKSNVKIYDMNLTKSANDDVKDIYVDENICNEIFESTIEYINKM